jgi:hypothetical protein
MSLKLSHSSQKLNDNQFKSKSAKIPFEDIDEPLCLFGIALRG